MATRTSSTISFPGFVADPNSLRRSTGRQIDWSVVTAKDENGKKHVKPGTVVVELANGKVAPYADRPDTEPAFGILEAYANEDDRNAALSGYGVLIGGHFYENALPDASGSPKVLAAAIKTDLTSRFSFEQYKDSRLA